MQFLSGGRYVADVADGKATLFPGHLPEARGSN